jgi:hypothetical protein
MTSQEIKELLSGVITNLESPQPQQWQPSWIEKLKTLKDSIPEPYFARTHDPYYDDVQPLVDALDAVCDYSSDYYDHEHDFRFGKIFNIACEATGGTRRIEPDDE